MPSRLYVFPGGVLEIEESEDQEPGVGIWLCHRSDRGSPEGYPPERIPDFSDTAGGDYTEDSAS